MSKIASNRKGIGPLGAQVDEHLSKFRPKMYRQLKDSGNLNQYLLGVEKQAQIALGNLYDLGYTYDEAMEIVGPQYLYLPSEEEMPELGGPRLSLDEQDARREKAAKTAP